jgi:hypothetical protein
MSRLVQLRTPEGERAVAVVDGDVARRLADARTVYELALESIAAAEPLVARVRARRTTDIVDLDEAEAQGRLLPPLDHPSPAHCWITGTGLTHLGSAEARDKMHRKLQGDEAPLTASMKMFTWGVEGGKPAGKAVGVQPEWFFKGNGTTLVGSGQPLRVPSFALDSGEEPEVVGLYVVSEDGTPCRVGYALGNELTDHVMERSNYLYLAHAKLRPCAVGPELLLGPLPQRVNGTSRILRDGKVLWEKPFVSGEANMSHWLASLEHHHFKYPMFRRPGDVHLHFFGTSTLSSKDGISTAPGDVFEISAPIFGRPLRNALDVTSPSACEIRAL